MKKTALMMAIEWVQENSGDINGGGCLQEIFCKLTELLQTEREQIESAYLASQKKCVDTIEKYAGISLPKSKAAISEIEQGGKNEDASDYFDQNYKTDKE